MGRGIWQHHRHEATWSARTTVPPKCIQFAVLSKEVSQKLELKVTFMGIFLVDSDISLFREMNCVRLYLCSRSLWSSRSLLQDLRPLASLLKVAALYSGPPCASKSEPQTGTTKWGTKAPKQVLVRLFDPLCPFLTFEDTIEQQLVAYFCKSYVSHAR
eukprot:3186788-Amphidinium_carterae.1